MVRCLLSLQKYTLLSSESTWVEKININTEIKSLIEVGDNGRDVIDTAFAGLAEYVTVATDIEFAKKLIRNVPKFLTGGTDSVEKIGRIKVKQEELYNALIESAEEKKKKENDFITTSQTSERLNTYNYLESQKNNPDFNLEEYKNDPRRSNQEIIAINQFKEDISTDESTLNEKMPAFLDEPAPKI